MAMPTHSNLQSLVESLTPLVPPCRRKGDKEQCFFSLGQLWEEYKEWSAYGVGVPLRINKSAYGSVGVPARINNRQTCNVIQHYLPTLSAIQIFTNQAFDSSSGSGGGGDGMPKSLEGGAKEGSSVEAIRAGGGGSNGFGHLYFKFNETKNPHERLPLTDKIDELAKQYPGLKNFCISELSPYSWVAIAWYPIYSIPLIKGRKDLTASFLTYHPLSSSSPDFGTEDTKIRLENDGEGDERFRLGIFGLAAYRIFDGIIWFNHTSWNPQRIHILRNAIAAWLKLLNFFHHDFNFFNNGRPFA